MDDCLLDSFDNLLLYQPILVELADVLAVVDLVSASLGERDNKALAEAAEDEDSHDAKVKDHGSMSVHLFHARHILFLVVHSSSWWLNSSFVLVLRS